MIVCDAEHVPPADLMSRLVEADEGAGGGTMQDRGGFAVVGETARRKGGPMSASPWWR
ncbi:MAG: hypothetical protein RML45_15060 [Acetobacteraceae bacterium]|nr:hypothetical protein [Acetobacteraceae bacterium]